MLVHHTLGQRLALPEVDGVLEILPLLIIRSEEHMCPPIGQATITTGGTTTSSGAQVLHLVIPQDLVHHGVRLIDRADRQSSDAEIHQVSGPLSFIGVEESEIIIRTIGFAWVEHVRGLVGRYPVLITLGEQYVIVRTIPE